jgi:hypothetical protein
MAVVGNYHGVCMRYSKLTFVLGLKRGRGGAALLRGEQLAEIVRPVCSEIGVTVDVHVGIEGIENSAVIANKTAIMDHGADGLKQLREQGNQIILDPIDGPFRKDILSLGDCLISCSREQTNFYQRELPEIPCIYVPHHADLRLKAYKFVGEGRRCAYIGDPLNGLYLQHLEEEKLITVIKAVDRKGGWMNELLPFSVHYAIRPKPPNKNIYKPFTKGAVAAECNAVIFADRNDLEAVHALGENYPFYSDSKKGQDYVARDLRRILASQDDDAWQIAKVAMEAVRKEHSAEHIREIFKRDLIATGLLLGMGST